jgi:ketosteroid isomerase-like protein
MTNVEDSIRRLSDRADICDLLTSYFRALDSLDQEAALVVYAEDARLAHDGEPVASGRDEIAAFVASSWSRRSDIRITHYLVGAPTVHVEGDRATSETYAVTHQVKGDPGDGAIVIARGLRYMDTWRRTPAGWRVVDRLHVKDFEMSADALYSTTFEQRIRAPWEEQG